MFEKLEKVMMPLAEAIGKNKYLIAVRDGFLVSTPLLIVGSIFLLIGNFPIEAWTNWLSSTTIGNMSLASLVGKPADATFTIMAVFATMGIGYSFAKQIKTTPIFGAAVTLMAWYILMPYSVSGGVTSLINGAGETVELAEKMTATVGGISTGWIGAKGILSVSSVPLVQLVCMLG